MSILLDESARVLIVGAEGRFGRRSLEDLRAAGTSVVAGVSHVQRGTNNGDLPIFGTVDDACDATAPNAAIVYVPATVALDPLLETLEAGVALVVYPGEGLPVADAIEVRSVARRARVTLVGPNTPGVISPGKAKLGFMPTSCYVPGSVGIISRSGSLSYEAAQHLSVAGIGQSTSVGIGGDPIKGLTASECLRLFHDDPQTAVVVYLGEIGGSDEYGVADYASTVNAKPVVAHIVGRAAPVGKTMGHAAALIGAHRDSWEAKAKSLGEAGAYVTHSMSDLVEVARSLTS